MTETEFDGFLKRLFIRFPGLAQWVNEWSLDPSESIAVWRSELLNVELELAERVLHRWTTGELEDAPTGYQRERFLPNLLTHIRSLRFERRRIELQATTREAIGRKPDSKPLPSAEAIYAACRARLSSVAGEGAQTPAEIAQQVYAAAAADLENSNHGN
jgi:hypothetical protein